jgi:hypothetical protein
LSVGGDTLLGGTFGEGIFRSTDNGNTWLQVVPHGVTINSFAYHTEGKILAAADTNGVYLSTDNGTNWSTINSGLEGREVNHITLDVNGFAFAGTIGGGVFASSERITSVDENDGKQPDSYILAQNYPNPFNPSTTIHYQLPGKGFVTLKVFNILGQEVGTLVNEDQEAGSYQIQFDGTGLASGVYFYRLSAEEFVETKKLVLLR